MIHRKNGDRVPTDHIPSQPNVDWPLNLEPLSRTHRYDVTQWDLSPHSNLFHESPSVNTVGRYSVMLPLTGTL